MAYAFRQPNPELVLYGNDTPLQCCRRRQQWRRATNPMIGCYAVTEPLPEALLDFC